MDLELKSKLSVSGRDNMSFMQSNVTSPVHIGKHTINTFNSFPLTEVTNRENAEYRSKVKDGLIILQGLLLAVFIAAIILRKQKLVRNKRNKTPFTSNLSQTVQLSNLGELEEELEVPLHSKISFCLYFTSE